MSGSLREIDITPPTHRLLPYVRRDSLSPRVDRVPEVREETDKPVLYKATESLASGKGVVLPRFKRAVDSYQQNMDARRTLMAGPLFVDTYA